MGKAMMDYNSASYESLLSQAAALEPADQLRLLEALAGLVRQKVDVLPRHSVREFRGLGKEIWQGVDAQQYVDKERSAWGG
jgi:hypothetical protein